MRFRRVLLIHPATTPHLPEYPPVGLGYLGEALRQHGVEHTVVDLRLGGDETSLHERIASFRPDLIGISLVTLLHGAAYALVRGVREAFPHIPIAAGGPHVSTYREEVLRQNQAIDFGVTVEGEHALLDLCRGADPAGIPGILYRSGGPDREIRYSGDRPYITDLDGLGFPTYEGFELARYPAEDVAILTSRGCPYACIFCAAQAVIGRRYRFRGVRSVADEIAYWAARGRRRFNIIDDNFTLRRERVLALCDELERRGLTGLEFRCPNGIRADRCDRELLRRMREVGFRYIAFGAESGSERVLRRINKGETLEDIRRSTSLACDLGFDVGLFFIVGAPGETWDDLEASVALALEFPVADAKFFSLIPLPGTELFRWVDEHGYFVTPPDEYLNDPAHWQNDARWDRRPVFATPELPLDRRVEALHYVAEVQRTIRARAEARRAAAG